MFRCNSKSLAVASALLCLTMPFAAAAQGRTTDVEAGPIWSQSDAQSKCPEVAEANGAQWTGVWKTTVPGRMSVCELRLKPGRNYDLRGVEAGPIWSKSDAERKCPEVAKANYGVWTGEWSTTVPGRMSVCEVRIRR